MVIVFMYRKGLKGIVIWWIVWCLRIKSSVNRVLVIKVSVRYSYNFIGFNYVFNIVVSLRFFCFILFWLDDMWYVIVSD